MYCSDCNDLGLAIAAPSRDYTKLLAAYRAGLTTRTPSPTTATVTMRPVTTTTITRMTPPPVIAVKPAVKAIAPAPPLAMPAKSVIASGGGMTTGGTIPTLPAEIAAETAGMGGKFAISPLMLLAAAAGVYLLTKKGR